jgi:hypothetical protein
MKRYLLSILFVLVAVFVFVPTALAQGDPAPVNPVEWLRDPSILAGFIMLIFPQLFDLFEQFLVLRGWDAWLSGPNRKRLLAWVLAAPVALLAQLFAGWVLKEPFTIDSVAQLAGAIVPLIIVSQVAYLPQKRGGMIISGRAKLLDAQFPRG